MNHRDYTVGDYLLDRLAEAGVRHLFGVPGDYNLALLDHVLDHQRITWVGNANELNAAYAADGYARVNGVGALVTTYGVGELSAINGVAGSYAEYLPVIHVVGAPSTAARDAGALMHHTLGDGDFDHFARAQAEVTVAQATLSRGDATSEIDRVIATALRERRPGYLVLPTDVAAAPAEPPAGALAVPGPDFSARVLADFGATARRMLADAGSLTVLADFLADRFGARGDLAGLIDAGHIPNATLAMGKGVLDEGNPYFAGVYSGAASDKPVLRAVEGADLLISFGVRYTDTITTGFSQRIEPRRTIDVQPFATRIGDRDFAPLPMRAAVGELTRLVRELGRGWEREDTQAAAPEASGAADAPLSQAALWPAVGEFLRPGDIVVAEQGTSLFGVQATRLPTGVTFVGQPLWGSIGYTLPAALGAATAAPGRRTVLLIGDGSALLTAQEFGTILRDGRRMVVLLVNNSGYTVERAIHGAEQRYNDVPGWDWSLVPAAMGGAGGAEVARVGTAGELAAALEAAADPKGLVLVEALLPTMDVPDLLAAVSRAIAERNAPALAE